MTMTATAVLSAALLAAPFEGADQLPPQPVPPQPQDLTPGPDLPTALPVDLIIASIDMPECVDAGAPLGSRLDVEIENLFAGQVQQDFAITFEVQSLQGGSAQLVQGRQVVNGIGGSTRKSVALTPSLALPSGMPIGPAELIVELDPDDNVEETDETNNSERVAFIAGVGQECT